MNIAGFHQLRFHPSDEYLKKYEKGHSGFGVFENDATKHKAFDEDEEEVSYIQSVRRFRDSFVESEVLKLFNLPLSDFTRLHNVTLGKRRYQRGFSYLGYIMIGISNYSDKERISFEINGKGFDFLPLDIEVLTAEIDKNYVVTTAHGKIDTDEIPFKHLHTLGSKGLWTAGVTIHEPLKSPDESKDNPRTLSFGTKNRGCSIYEAGKFHDHIGKSGTIRLEIKLESHEARHFFTQFRANPTELEKLIKSHVADTFGIKFHTTKSKDLKISRRPLDPKWEAWLGTWVPVRWEKPRTSFEIVWEDIH